MWLCVCLCTCMCVCVCAYEGLYAPLMYSTHRNQNSSSDPWEPGMVMSCHMGSRDLNLGPLWEQLVFLTTEPSLFSCLLYLLRQAFSFNLGFTDRASMGGWPVTCFCLLTTRVMDIWCHTLLLTCVTVIWTYAYADIASTLPTKSSQLKCWPFMGVWPWLLA